MELLIKDTAIFDSSGRRLDLVDSKTLCKILSVSKTETLIKMAERGDLPQPIYLNIAISNKRGRNMVRWNLPDVLRQLGLI